MRTLMYRFLVIGLLAVVLMPCFAADAPNKPSMPTVADLLKQPVKITKIEQGTTLMDAIFSLLPLNKQVWYANDFHEFHVHISNNAKLLPLPAMTFNQDTLQSALVKIVAATDAEYKVTYDYNPELNPADVSVSRKPSNDLNRLVYFEFNGITLDSALQSLISSTGMNYVISPELGSLQVNAKLKGVSISTALSALLRAVGADYEISNNIINIKVSQVKNAAISQYRATQQAGFPNVQPRSAQPAPANSLGLAEAISANRAVTSEKQDKIVSKNIDLKYANASDIAPIISNQGVDVMSTNSRKVVITGPESQVTQALNLAQSVDNDSYLPKPVRILLAVKTLSGLKGKLTPLNVIQSEISTFDGQQASVDISSTSGAMNIRGTITATPTILPNGSIGISGSFKCEMKHTFANNRDTSSSPEISFRAKLVPGSEQTVAGIKNETPQTGETTSIELTAVAALDNGKVAPPAPAPQMSTPTPRSNTGVIKKKN